ncbi:MAG TPA: isoaspartyl peptidase/L-asparaginase [Isosphaeraceae bacterium]|jgi:beta-aspartyl-peptidase (threonine type)
MTDSEVVLVVHGGADPLPRDEMTPERQEQYRGDLEHALRSGHEVLRRAGGTSLDAVEAAIRVLEDSPLFNAGRGAAFNREGRNELDAALIEGRERRAGAVAGLTAVKNPIAAARAVMEASGHVFLIGPAADGFARDQGLEMVDPSYYWTEQRWRALREKQSSEREPGGPPAHRVGTVGAVARDRAGDLAAGASTGGTTNKRAGRVGDTPVVGAGIYAENGVGAVSCTGDGESFIRYAVAYAILAQMKHAGLAAEDAAVRVLEEAMTRTGGEGGVIVLDAAGRCALPYRSPGMYRGLITGDGRVRVAFYERWLDEE